MKKQTPNRIILINALSAGLLNGISMIMMPVYSYLLGTDNYGLASIYTTWSSILAIIIGLQAASAIAVAQKDFSAEEQLSFQANGVYLGLIMTAVLSIVFFAFSEQISSVLSLPKWSVQLLCPHAFGIFCIGMLNSKFTYEFKQDKNLLLSVSMSLGTAFISVVAILCMSKEQRYFGKVIGTAVPQIICGMILLFFLINRIGFGVKSEYLQYIVYYSLPLVFSNLCLHLFSSSDKLMLQKMMSNSEVGVYSLAFNFAGVVSAIWSALNHAWGPFYYRYEAAGNDVELLDHVKNYTWIFSILTTGFILLAPEVFSLFAAPDFRPGKALIPIFVIGHYLNFVGCYARNHQYYHKSTKCIAIITVGSALFNLILNLILIPAIGAMGASVATMAAQFISLIFNWITAKYYTSKTRVYPYKFNLFYPYFLIIGAAVILFYIPNTWAIRWIFGVMLGLCLAMRIIKTKQIF